MQAVLPYLIMILLAGLLVGGQALWGTVIKGGTISGSLPQMAVMLLMSWRMWAGAGLYIIATLLYFFMLSRIKFFSVQVGMTALSIIFSTTLSVLLFHEKLSILNIIGIVIVATGAVLVLQK